jgi:hypothetical protein
MSRIRAIPIVLALLLAAGCTPEFQDEHEEYSYLSKLSNPTPEQLLRRQELGQRQEAEHAQQLDRAEAERKKALDEKEAERRARNREKSHEEFVEAQQKSVLRESLLKFK